jgi:two-component system, cell cycle sensor histidine kinase and response regulator CckA
MASILVVDDEASLVQLVTMILRQSAYTVLSASSGVEALMVYSSYRTEVDLVLTDIMMPGMNGIELAQRIRALKPTVKILLMSGFTPDNIEVPGDLPLLKKPFLPARLIETVEAILAG